MSRKIFTILTITLLALPITAKAVEPVLPAIIQNALHDAAMTGNPLVVDAIADRMGHLFPSYRSEIGSYVETVVTPATQVMANVNGMLAALPPETDAGMALFESCGTTDEDQSTSLAEDLNDLDVGAGTESASAF